MHIPLGLPYFTLTITMSLILLLLWCYFASSQPVECKCSGYRLCQISNQDFLFFALCYLWLIANPNTSSLVFVWMVSWVLAWAWMCWLSSFQVYKGGCVVELLCKLEIIIISIIIFPLQFDHCSRSLYMECGIYIES